MCEVDNFNIRCSIFDVQATDYHSFHVKSDAQLLITRLVCMSSLRALVPRFCAVVYVVHISEGKARNSASTMS